MCHLLPMRARFLLSNSHIMEIQASNGGLSNLSYDAMYALLQGCQNVLSAQNTLTSTTLPHGLTQITGPKAFQGASGQISFGINGDPIDKAIVILYVDQDGHIHLLEKNGVQGCFVVGQC